MSDFQTVDDVRNFLDSIPMFQKKGAAAANFSLDNIRSFCKQLGNPQNEYPSIHVAGTNGKGTTCYLLEKIYLDAGYKTGMFTSPHLLRYNERVRVSGREISDEELLCFFQTAAPLFDEIQLSYFEISTALAFWYFAEAEVDIAIIETGLGGRLDATNIIIPEVSVISSVGLDHQQVLGNSLEEIAREKAGIIKKEKPVVIGKVDGGALQVIREIAESRESKVYRAADINPNWRNKMVELENGRYDIPTNFYEPVNAWNVAAAWLVADILQPQFPLKKQKTAKSVSAFAGAPGRFEKLHPKYEWYFSGSHNLEALQSSMEAVAQLKPRQEAVLVFSMMKDKWNEQAAGYFSGFKETWFVQQEGERALSFDEISLHVPAKRMDKQNAKIILKELQTELVIFVGSFYFYPTIKRWTSNHQH